MPPGSGRAPGSQEFRTIAEIVDAARERLSPDLWDHVTGGSGTEASLERNRTAWSSFALRPRVLRDVSARGTATTFLGRSISLPVMLGPIGGIARVDPSGAVGVARAAGEAGTVAFISVNASHTLEEVRRATPDTGLVFQIYAFRDDDLRRSLLERAQVADYLGICVTVDTNVYGRRDRDLRSGFIGRDGSSANYGGREWTDEDRAAATWEQIERIREETDLPLILKGIMTGEDAALAVEHGTDVVYVSNHGGRQLDGTLGTAHALFEIVEAVDRRASVIVDGGVLHGTDCLKGLALGADAVLIGRLQAWALAAGGVAGLVNALDILRAEVDTGLGLLGCVTPGDVDSGHLAAVPDRY